VDQNGDGQASWGEVKQYQLKHGDMSNGQQPYNETVFPVVRCFYHYAERSYQVTNTLVGMTINVGYAGNVFQAPLEWEKLSIAK
jgi:hypothetical protein